MSPELRATAPTVDFARMRGERRARDYAMPCSRTAWTRSCCSARRTRSTPASASPAPTPCACTTSRWWSSSTRPGDAPHVWTPFPRGSPTTCPSDQVHGPIAVEFAEGVEALARAIAETVPGARRIGIDELTGPMMQRPARPARRQSSGPTPPWRPERPGSSRHPTRSRACGRPSASTRSPCTTSRPPCGPASARTSCRGSSCAGVFELGASTSIIDPIWNITPLSVAAER